MSAATKPTKTTLPILMIMAACLFLTGIQWGLPSRSADPFLFGNRTSWTGRQILSLAPDWSQDTNRAADVAAHPLAGRDRPIIVNQTDSQRAAIVRRYRLYSDQPDEMITLRALAQMKPAQLKFDPKLYQYGGLWIYPVGGILRVASLLKGVRLTPDLAFYLDHPEAFGRLYVVMRLYSVAWGLLGVAVMFSLAHRISASRIVGATAAVCYMLLPTVINGAHEAKPHLAGAVLGLIALDLAIRAIDSGRIPWAIAAGVACGASAGMVLSGWLSIGILPAMAFFMPRRAALLRPPVLAQHGSAGSSSATFQPNAAFQCGAAKKNAVRFLAITCTSCAVTILTYAISNPYVILHLVGDRTILQSNLGNSAAMYQGPASIGGIFHGIGLLFDGGSIMIAVGACGIVFSLPQRKAIQWLLLAATIPALLLFLAHATGKPGEYGRFALPVDVLFVVGSALAQSEFKRTRDRAAMGLLMCVMLLPTSASYLLGFVQDAFGHSTRFRTAEELQQWSANGASTLAINSEPAPYVLPPVDLFEWKIILMPAGAAMPHGADVRIDPADGVGPDIATIQSFISPPFLATPISWAAKPFRIEIRQDVFSAAKARR